MLQLSSFTSKKLRYLQLNSCNFYYLQVDLHLHPTINRDLPHQTLEERLVEMMAAYRNPDIPPFDALPLVQAYNECVHTHQQLPLGQANCAIEFLSATYGDGLLGHLQLIPNYIVSYQQLGQCPRCQINYQQVIMN